jgi:hypothetical protein
MERAGRHYEIDVCDAGDHISGSDSSVRSVVRVLSRQVWLHIIYALLWHKVRSTYTSHVTRPSDKVTRT